MASLMQDWLRLFVQQELGLAVAWRESQQDHHACKREQEPDSYAIQYCAYEDDSSNLRAKLEFASDNAPVVQIIHVSLFETHSTQDLLMLISGLVQQLRQRHCTSRRRGRNLVHYRPVLTAVSGCICACKRRQEDDWATVRCRAHSAEMRAARDCTGTSG